MSGGLGLEDFIKDLLDTIIKIIKSDLDLTSVFYSFYVHSGV